MKREYKAAVESAPLPRTVKSPKCKARNDPSTKKRTQLTANSGEVSLATRPDGIHGLSGLTLDSDVMTTPFGYSRSDLISKPEQLPPRV